MYSSPSPLSLSVVIIVNFDQSAQYTLFYELKKATEIYDQKILLYKAKILLTCNILHSILVIIDNICCLVNAL